MIQHYTLPISPASQAVHVLVLISTHQPHGLKDGACSLAPPRASISQLEGQRNRAHLCEWTGSPSPRSGHINTLGWYLTTHWHGMTTFPMYTARARGCWESCGVLMVTFPRCAWKESTKLQFEYACAVWSGGSTRSLQRLQDSFAKRLGLTLPPLKNRFNYHTLVLFYKIRQNLVPKYLCSLVPDLSSTTSGYSFRKFSYPVPPHKKSATLESFLPRAITVILLFFGVVLFSVFSVVNGFTEIKETPNWEKYIRSPSASTDTELKRNRTLRDRSPPKFERTENL